MGYLLSHPAEVLYLTWQHFILVVVSIGVAAVIGIPLGIVLTRKPTWSRWILGAANIIQTIPSLALFGFLIPLPLLGGIGARTAIIALILYALLPIIQNTHAGIVAVDPAIREAGKGMGETLQMAGEKGAYTLTDEGTFLAYAGKTNLVPIVDKGTSLMNLYSVMTVYAGKPQPQKITMANNFVNWLISPETLTDIGNYGKDKYGKGLFTPMSSGIPAGVIADFTSPATETSPPQTEPAVANGTAPYGKPY